VDYADRVHPAWSLAHQWAGPSQLASSARIEVISPARADPARFSSGSIASYSPAPWRTDS
jgi:hypothetical protein